MGQPGRATRRRLDFSTWRRAESASLLDGGGNVGWREGVGAVEPLHLSHFPRIQGEREAGEEVVSMAKLPSERGGGGFGGAGE
jgi:hypothetical protein